MEQSPRLSLSYVMPSQAQKHVTVNESFRRLDALTQLTVVSRTVTAEPASPAEGDAYILPIGAGGAVWDAFDTGDITAFQDGAWARIAPIEGFCAWVSDDDEFVAYDGAGWSQISGGGSSETAAKFGVNTAADVTNRLAVKSDAILFNHDDITPGSGDCQVKINKDGAGDTASLLFQAGASGRAEAGLTGDDDFHIKVSPDNFSTSHEAITIDKDNGKAVFHKVASFINSDGYILLSNTTADNANKSGLVTVMHYDTDAQPVSVFGALISTGANQVLYGWSGSLNAPTSHEFWTGATTTTVTGTKRGYFGTGFVVGSPTGGDKGAGSINAQSVYDDNTLLSCYVFDQALDGVVDQSKWDAKVPDRIIEGTLYANGEKGASTRVARSHGGARKFSARIGGAEDPLTLDGYARHWKEKRHLTSMPNEAGFDPVKGQLTTGEWIQRLVETVEIQAVLIETLNERVKIIETRGRG